MSAQPQAVPQPSPVAPLWDAVKETPRVATARLESVDVLRGLIMVIMALDHVRDFFALEDLPAPLFKAAPALFFTRWVTHYCAPVFFFLGGASAFLASGRGRSPGQLSRFLLTRGLWLVVLELTAVRLGWFFNLDYSIQTISLGVIWALGWSMVVLAGLVHLPRGALGALGGVMVVGHHLLDGTC